MRISLLVAALLFSLAASGQRQVAKKTWLYGEPGGKISQKIIVDFQAAGPETSLAIVQLFKEQGVEVVSWQEMFFDGAALNPDSLHHQLISKGIATVLHFEVSDKKTGNFNLSNAVGYSTLISRNAHIYTGLSAGKTIQYTSDESLKMQIFCSNDNFTKPVAVLVGESQGMGLSSEMGMTKKIVRRMIEALVAEKAFVLP